MSIKSVLFDLDGTLFDTAGDLMNAVNHVLKNHNKAPIVMDQFRYHIYEGSKSMLAHAFGIKQTHPDFQPLKQALIDHYAQYYAVETVLFPGMAELLQYLDTHAIPWGIVTNKPGHLTIPLLRAFGLDQRSHCVVAGDTLKQCKPSPVPLQYACELLHCETQTCVYIGDTEIDIQAARAAKMTSIAVTYGYHQQHSQPHQWKADFVVNHANEILHWIKQRLNDHA